RRGLVGGRARPRPFEAAMTTAKTEVKADAEWRTLHAEPSGKFDLTGSMGAANTAVYARAYVYSPKRQSVSGVVATVGGVRVWVNDSGVLGPLPTLPDSTARESAFEAELKQGWNVLLVKVANPGRPVTLALRVAGTGLRTAGTPDNTPLPGTASGGQ